MRDPNIAIAHKDFDTRGGGEVFCRRLAAWLDCPLYVGRNNQSIGPDTDDVDLREIPLSRGERWGIDHGGLARAVAYMSAWQGAAEVLAEYDVVITSGNEPMWYVPPDEQTLIAYTHSTPRFMYDLYPGRAGAMGGVARLFNAGKRTLYQHNTARPDLWVANSDRVARRIERYHHVERDDIRTVYPPVDTHNYAPDDADTAGFYLHLGRLVEHKRPELLVKAFNGLSQRLVIAGPGPERDRLEAMADDNIEFRGFVEEAEKRRLMAAATAHVYAPQNEDFGMVPIESMAAGTPVLGVDEGFTKYQIQDGANGYLFAPTATGVADAVRRFEDEGVAWSAREIAAYAEQFGVGQFREGMADAIDTAIARAAVTPTVETARPAVEHDAPLPDGGAE